MFFCYCFNNDGKYDKAEPFDNPEDAVEYVARKQHLFPRIIITDILDCTVLEMVNGEVVFPTREDMAKAQSEQPVQQGNAPNTFNNKLDRFLEELNINILPRINYDVLQESYGTSDKLYAKITLKQMHDAFVNIFNTDFLKDGEGEFVLLPALVKGRNTGELCVALVTIDLSSSGEHCGTDFLTKYGVLRQETQASYQEQKEFINKHYMPYQYFYTVRLENDIHVNPDHVPEDIKKILDYCHAQQEQTKGMEFEGL